MKNLVGREAERPAIEQPLVSYEALDLEIVPQVRPDVTKSTVLNARPFLKWAGGKSRLLPELLKRVPANFSTYFEPFVGGGALFFALRPKLAVLADTNAELINLYTIVQNQVEALIAELSQYKHSKRQYYQIRDRDRDPAYWIYSPVERAARFLYLNKTCFNGLYRVNSRGEFNVPFGDYDEPRIVDEENLRACALALEGVHCRQASFLELEDEIPADAFVYFDPPYLPINETSNFTSYTKDGFSLKAQEELAEVCLRLHRRGVKFLLSNSRTAVIESLYSDFRIDIVHASRSINSKGDARGKIEEIIVSNYEFASCKEEIGK